MRLRLCDCIAVHLCSISVMLKSPCMKLFSWFLKTRKGEVVFFFNFHLNACLFFFFVKFRPKQLRKAPSCWAEFRKTCSADILDFARGLKCQQADFRFFFSPPSKGAGRISHFNFGLGISASHSGWCVTRFQRGFGENPARFCSFPIISPTQIEHLIWIFMTGERGGLWSQ